MHSKFDEGTNKKMQTSNDSASWLSEIKGSAAPPSLQTMRMLPLCEITGDLPLVARFLPSALSSKYSFTHSTVHGLRLAVVPNGRASRREFSDLEHQFTPDVASLNHPMRSSGVL